MILFLNFAPLEYMGGAERKTYQLYREIQKKEPVIILTANFLLGGIYGKIALNQPFEDRSNQSLKFGTGQREFISFKSLIPYTRQWKHLRLLTQNARIIYIKGDINEFLLLLYFGGLSSLKKTIASVLSPWYYPAPLSFMDRLHNALYMSVFMKWLLKKIQTIHVLTKRDEQLLMKKFGISHTVIIPNFADSVEKLPTKYKKKDRTDIIFIGELIPRKGIDILQKVIMNSTPQYHFHVIGDGPGRSQIETMVQIFPNITYYGYLPTQEVQKVLRKSDVLFLPSRSEGFGGVVLEAMSAGIPIINNLRTTLNLPEYIEYSSPSDQTQFYLQLIEKCIANRTSAVRDKIQRYFRKHFSASVVLPHYSRLFYEKSSFT